MRKFRQLLVLLVVMVVFGSASAVPAGAQTDRPTAEDFIIDLLVTRGDTVEVDIAAAFSGTVDSYGAESSDTAVATVSTSGSTVSITALAVGSSFVTISATNSAGTTDQWFEVIVVAPTPPLLEGQLNAQATTVGAIVALDVTPLFSGRITSHSVSSSDTTILDASLDETILVLRGVAEGTATATLTATGPGGSTSQTFAVTVGAAAPPLLDAPTTTTATLATQTITVGATRQLDVAAAFSGTVTIVIPVTADATIATAALHANTTIALTAVAPGTTTIRIVAVNTGGIATQTLTLTAIEPQPPTITATAPTHCLTGEGTPTTIGSNTGRTGIATIDITYTIIGGVDPYTITSPDATTDATGHTGTITVHCARTGLSLNDIAPNTNAVESGPKTITLTATDNNEDTTTTTITITVVEAVTTAQQYNAGTLTAGSTYVIGSADQPHLITLPASLDLNLDGISTVEGRLEAAYLSDTISGSIIHFDWATGIELYREVIADGDEDSANGATPPTRDIQILFDTLADSVVTLTQDAYDGDAGGTSRDTWRPYGDLSATTRVALHEKVMRGETMMVCNMAQEGNFDPRDFDDEDPRDDGRPIDAEYLLDRFDDAFDNAIADWNRALHERDGVNGTPSPVFAPVTDDSICDPDTLTAEPVAGVDIFIHKRVAPRSGKCDDTTHYPTDEDRKACRARHYDLFGRPCNYSGGCARRVFSNDESLVMNADVTQHALVTRLDSDWFRSTIAHELGHFLGLGDREACPSDGSSTLYTYTSSCRSTAAADASPVTERDVRDVHEIYHPDQFTNVRVETDGTGAMVDYEIKGHVPLDTAMNPEFNAYRIVVWSRMSDEDNWSFVGSADVFEDDGTVDPDLRSSHEFTISSIAANPSALDFLVVGVTRGDPDRLSGDPDDWTEHAEVTARDLGSETWAMEVDWTLGEPVTVDGVTTTDPDPDPPPPITGPTKVPPAPVLRVTVTTNSATLTWSESTNDGDRAATYTASYVSGNLDSDSETVDDDENDDEGTVTFGNLDSWTGYTFKVTATNDIGSADSNVVFRRTSETVSGEIEVRRLPQGRPSGHDIEFSFVPSGTGETRILPSLRFVDYSDLTVGNWVRSSNVVRTRPNPDQTLGRIAARLVADGRVEVCLLPPGGTGESDHICPSRKFFPYLSATENRWLSSSQVSVTVADPNTAASSSGAAGAAGADTATMAPLAPGETLPEADTERGRLEE